MIDEAKTFRDELAMLAMRELLVASRLDYPEHGDRTDRLYYNLSARARRKLGREAYRFADSMLLARQATAPAPGAGG